MEFVPRGEILFFGQSVIFALSWLHFHMVNGRPLWVADRGLMRQCARRCHLPHIVHPQLHCVGVSHKTRPSSARSTDDTKSVLPGATITATRLETGVQSSAVTRRQRSVPLEAAGRHLQAAGRALGLLDRASLPKVELLVGQNATIPFTLKLAQVSETLTVARRVAARRHHVVAGGRQRRSPADGRAAAAGPQLDGAVEAGQGHHRQRRQQHRPGVDATTCSS